MLGMSDGRESCPQNGSKGPQWRRRGPLVSITVAGINIGCARGQPVVADLALRPRLPPHLLQWVDVRFVVGRLFRETALTLTPEQGGSTSVGRLLIIAGLEAVGCAVSSNTSSRVTPAAVLLPRCSQRSRQALTPSHG